MARTSLAEEAEPPHRISLDDVRTSMAKADIKKVEKREFRSEIGRAIGRGLALAGHTQKEAAGVIGVDQGQMARWIAGTERPHLDRLFAVPEYREPLCVALAQMSGADVHTHVEFKKKETA